MFGENELLAEARSCSVRPTFVRHHFAGLEVHLGAAGRAHLVDVVAELVAAVLPAAEAQAFVEGLPGVAAKHRALLVGVEQRVDEEVDGALVGTLEELVHTCEAQKVNALSIFRFLFCPAAGTMSESRNTWSSRAHTLVAIDAPHRDSQQRVLDVAARLERATVGVNVNVSNRSLDADAAARGPPGVGVQDVHKLGIVGGEGGLVVCVFKGGACGIQAYGGKEEAAQNPCWN